MYKVNEEAIKALVKVVNSNDVREIAAKSGVGSTTVWKAINDGDMTADKLMDICKAYDVSPWEFIKSDGDIPKENYDVKGVVIDWKKISNYLLKECNMTVQGVIDLLDLRSPTRFYRIFGKRSENHLNIVKMSEFLEWCNLMHASPNRFFCTEAEQGESVNEVSDTSVPVFEANKKVGDIEALVAVQGKRIAEMREELASMEFRVKMLEAAYHSKSTGKYNMDFPEMPSRVAED